MLPLFSAKQSCLLKNKITHTSTISMASAFMPYYIAIFQKAFQRLGQVTNSCNTPLPGSAL